MILPFQKHGGGVVYVRMLAASASPVALKNTWSKFDKCLKKQTGNKFVIFGGVIFWSLRNLRHLYGVIQAASGVKVVIS